MDKTEAVKILDKALQAGEDALEACTPIPMIVQQHANMMDDSSQVIQSYHVPDGVCGFAWVKIPLTSTPSRQFINSLKKAKLATADINSHNDAPFKKSYYHGGYLYWVHQGNQSLQKKETFAGAFAKTLIEAGIVCHTGSRLD